MKRYTLSFIVLVIAIGIPFLFITPNERDVMSGDEGRDARIAKRRAQKSDSNCDRELL